MSKTNDQHPLAGFDAFVWREGDNPWNWGPGSCWVERERDVQHWRYKGERESEEDDQFWIKPLAKQEKDELPLLCRHQFERRWRSSHFPPRLGARWLY